VLDAWNRFVEARNACGLHIKEIGPEVPRLEGKEDRSTAPATDRALNRHEIAPPRISFFSSPRRVLGIQGELMGLVMGHRRPYMHNVEPRYHLALAGLLLIEQGGNEFWYR